MSVQAGSGLVEEPGWLNGVQTWIGRTEEAEEVLTPALIGRFLVTIGLPPSGIPTRNGDPAPTGMHWCVAPTALPGADLGFDGHPALGKILPPVPFARRMWAGGTIITEAPLRVGYPIRRRSTVVSIEVKEGRSGRLCFVAVDHEYRNGDELAVSERQDIVYRDASPGADSSRPPAPAPAWPTGSSRIIPTTPTLLFRYSALTFNGHRIHYDLPYARDVEAYPGLVVHGPLQATWMLIAAEQARGRAPNRFRFRGVRPLICGGAAHVTASETGAVLSVHDDEGATTMTAEAEWQGSGGERPGPSLLAQEAGGAL